MNARHVILKSPVFLGVVANSRIVSTTETLVLPFAFFFFSMSTFEFQASDVLSSVF